MPETMKDMVIRLHVEGKTNGQIRIATGLSRGTIGGHIDRWRKSQRTIRNNQTHQLKPYAPAMVERSMPTFDRDREAEIRQREGDQKLVLALARAIWRGDHLPEGTPKPFRLMG